MLDKLIELGKEQIGGQLSSHLDGSQINQSMSIAKDTIFDGLKGQVLSGNISGVLDLFNGKSATDNSNPIVSSLISSYAGNIIQKLGIPANIGQMVANMVIPAIMSKFASKETGTAENGNNLMSMLGMDNDNMIGGFLQNALGGNKKDDDGGLLGTLGKLF